MTRTPAFVALSAALFVSTPALAAGPDAHAHHNEVAKPAKAEKICRDLGARTGSRINNGKRCRTAEEWAKIDGNESGAKADMRNLGSISRTNR